MYIKSFTLTNFRKFGDQNNTIEFCAPTAVDTEQNGAQDEETTDTKQIGTSSTLVIGRNNSGKSTVIKALQMLTADSGTTFKTNDFNYQYLGNLLASANDDTFDETPHISFCLEIGLDPEGKDIVSNMGNFVTPDIIQNRAEKSVPITINWELREEESYRQRLKSKREEKLRKGEEITFPEYLELLDGQRFHLVYRNLNDDDVEPYKLSNLIRLKTIEANDVSKKENLSAIFNQILKNRHKRNSSSTDPAIQAKHANLESKLEKIGSSVQEDICDEQSEFINRVVKDDILGSNWEASLTADVTFDRLLGSILRYEFKDNGYVFPEEQFGMGYTRLMMIIAHVIEHVDSLNEAHHRSTISLITIEEPENHMHPQMQSYFIQYIAQAVDRLVKEKAPYMGQLLITTHSDHIIHSKIQSSNTFNSINYIQGSGPISKVVVLTDDDIEPDKNGEQDEESLFNFLKKHIQLETNNLFFADAAMIVEGQTEKLLLPLYIMERASLRRYYVSIIGINGSHAHVYFNLLKTLGIPSVVITDLDIKKIKEESSEGETDGAANSSSKAKKKTRTNTEQIGTLNGRETTNPTLNRVMKECKLTLQEVSDTSTEYNGIKVFTQSQCQGYFPTSFEEALILENNRRKCNELLDDALQAVRPSKYDEITNSSKSKRMKRKKHVDNSRLWQKTLNNCKGNFCVTLLNALIDKTQESPIPNPSNYLRMPSYIDNALNHLESELTGSNADVE